MNSGIIRKFAWFPLIVDTWRPCGSTALIWMQFYYKQASKSTFSSLNGNSNIGDKWCDRLGLFSYEY